MSETNGGNLREVTIHLDPTLVGVFKAVAAKHNCTMKFAIESFLYAAMVQAKFEGEMGRKWKEAHPDIKGMPGEVERVQEQIDEGGAECGVKGVHEEAKSAVEDSTTSRESGASRADQSTPNSSESESGRGSLN
jgi:hypothetical protein